MFFHLIIIFFGIFGILRRGVLSSDLTENDRETIWKNSEKQIALMTGYRNFYWDKIMWDMYNKILVPVSEDDIPLCEIETKEMLISALHERFMAIQLNIACLHCVWYYRTKPKPFSIPIIWENKNNDDDLANQCAHAGEIMAWYNKKLSAKMFIHLYNAYTQKKDDLNEGLISKNENLSFEDLANLIDRVLKRLKNLNGIFKEAEDVKNYNDYLFRMISGYARPITSKTDREYHEITGEKLWTFLNQEVLQISDYMWSFFGAMKYTDYETLSPILSVAEKQYEYIQKTKYFEKKYSTIDKILGLESTLIYAEIEVHGIKPGKRFEYREWKVIKTDEGISSYKFIFSHERT